MEDGPSPNFQREFISQSPQIDAQVKNNIEIGSQYLANNIDGRAERLMNLLRSASEPAQLYINAIYIEYDQLICLKFLQ